MAMVRDSGQEKGNYSLGFTVYTGRLSLAPF